MPLAFRQEGRKFLSEYFSAISRNLVKTRKYCYNIWALSGFMEFSICLWNSKSAQEIFCILHERSEQSECSEVKGITNRHKKFCPPIYGWGFLCLCVCLSGLKSWITFDGMKGSWWNFRDQSNSSQVIFGQENQISRPKGYGHGLKTACF